MSNKLGFTNINSKTPVIKELFVTEKGYTVYVCAKYNKSTLHREYRFLVNTPEGDLRDAGTLRYREKLDWRCLGFFLVLDAGFNEECLKVMWKKISALEKELRANQIVLENTPPVQRIPKEFILYLYDNREEPESSEDARIFVEGAYIYIRTTYVAKVLDNLGWTDCKPGQLMDYLMMTGLLEGNGDRPDCNKRIKGKQTRCWRIRMPESMVIAEGKED